jgi:predicted transcriptional regulator
MKPIVEEIRSLATVSKAGPAPGFEYPQLCAALLLVGDEKAVGRTQLSKKLNLGEGTVRTIIRHLSRGGVVKSMKQGCTLTPKGKTVYKRLRAKLSKVYVVDARALALDTESMAVLVKGASRKVRQGLEQRDTAIRAGATGACTVLMKKGKFVMPMGSDDWKMDLEDPLVKELASTFHPEDDDAIIIASAAQPDLAEYAAIAAGLTLVD